MISDTDYEGNWQDINVVPVSMEHFRSSVGGANTSTAPYGGTTHVILYGDSPPGKRLMGKRYVDYTGNGASPGHLAYSACCMIIERVVNSSSECHVAQSSATPKND